ncbi:SLC13 family permease [Peribacillus alkalitolerans]|uniref:SLC13 family permease n=1 Tax=Peribacillus alkalitolerans TaxID=1550385 RepID=UPI0013D84D0E|nr:SLC13 family permease [Peribacillus alkalitolerans]
MTIHPMLWTFLLLVIMAFLFIHGRYRKDLIVLGTLIAFTLTGVLTTQEALLGFSNQTVITVAGLYIVAAGIFNTGLAKQMGNMALKIGGNSELKMLIIMMGTVAVLSGFLSNTGTVAILLPIVMSLAVQLQVSPSRFLIPLAFASSLGGMLTLIGSPSNLIVSSVLKEGGFEKLALFDLLPIGLVALVAGLVFMAIFGRKLLPTHNLSSSSDEKGLSAGELAGLYKIYDKLHFVHIPETSEIVGERLMDLKLPVRFETTVIEIERKQKEILSLKPSRQSIAAKADEILHPNDLLLVFGEEEQVDRFILHFELERKEFHLEHIKSHFLGKVYGMTEMVLPPHSTYEEKSLMDIHFREKYECNVLAIHRKGEYIQSGVAKEKMKPGDTLLIHGKWENIERISKEDRDVVVLGTISEEASSAYASGKASIAASILIFMLILWAFQIVSPVISVLLASFLMIVTGCVKGMEEAYQRINWESIVLIGAMIPMAIALEKSGASQEITELFLSIFGGFGGYGIMIGFFVITVILSQFINNIAIVIVLAPIALSTAVAQGINPYPIVIGVAIAASMAFSTPFASPANTLVMSAGGYTYKDFIKIGLPLQIVIGILMILVIPLFFPF